MGKRPPRFVLCLLFLCLLVPAHVRAQEPGDRWIEILEPAEWAGAATRGLTVRQRQTIRVVGLVRMPSGVDRVLLNGARAALSPDASGAMRFVGYIPVTASLERVEITAYTPDGRPLTRAFDVHPVQATQTYAQPGDAWPDTAHRGQRWAVVVGVSQYRDGTIPALKYADADAHAVYDFLTSERAGLGGFKADHVVLLLNRDATFRNVRTALFTFLKSATEDDQVVIYFAGHGAPDPDRPSDLYLLTYDTDVSNISGTAFPMEQMQDAIRRTYARDILVLTDACHSAGVGGQVSVRAAGRQNVINERFLQSLEASTGGIAIFTASEANQYSEEGDNWGGGHGVFTWALLQALYGAADTDGDHVVTLGEMLEFTRDRVRRETNNAQIPAISQTAFDRAMPLSVVTGEDTVVAISPEAAPPPLPDIFTSAPEPEAEPEAATAEMRMLSPTGAALGSLVLPGLGQAYTGKPVLGLAFLGGAGGAVAFGLLSKRTRVDCLVPPVAGACPAGQERGQTVDRPYLAPSIGAAAAFAVIAAWQAYHAAKRHNEGVPNTTLGGPSSPLQVGLTALDLDGARLRIGLVRLAVGGGR